MSFEDLCRAKTPYECFYELMSRASLDLYQQTMGSIIEITISAGLFNNIKWEWVDRSGYLSQEELQKVIDLKELKMMTPVGPILVKKDERYA